MRCKQHICRVDGASHLFRAPQRALRRKAVLVTSSSSSGSSTTSSSSSTSSATITTSSTSSSSTDNSSLIASSPGLQSSTQRWKSMSSSQQRPIVQMLAASGTAVALVASAPSIYQLLSSVTLPPITVVLEAAGACLAGSWVVAKAVHGDNVHVELHKGQLYVQLGVPKSGPALVAGSVVTRPTGDVRGNGAYATQLIPAGTHIADYYGEVLSNQAFFERYPDGVGDYVMAIDRDTVIDAAAWVAATDSFHPVHMNHSRNRPNVVRYYERAAGRVAFFATRDIQPGEELLFNYGAAYWKGREHLELP